MVQILIQIVLKIYKKVYLLNPIITLNIYISATSKLICLFSEMRESAEENRINLSNTSEEIWKQNTNHKIFCYIIKTNTTQRQGLHSGRSESRIGSADISL